MTEATSPQDDVLAVVEELGIQRVVHFTTNRGLLGTLSLRRLLSRQELADDVIVDLIALNNCFRRWDTDDFDKVNLSLQRINGYLYNISSGRWHNGEDLWWSVLDFDPVVLSHPGVTFVTTNNGYTAAKRAQGAAGLRALWAPHVQGYYGRWQDRAGRPVDEPTDPQAEVLYPGSVSTEWLRTIYVGDAELADEVHGYMDVTGHPPVPVVTDPEAFK